MREKQRWTIARAPPPWPRDARPACLASAPKPSTATPWPSSVRPAVNHQGLRGIPKDRVEEISPTAWFDQWWAANMATDAAGAAQSPPVLRAPNEVIKDIAEFWAKGRATYEPVNIRVPTLLILAEWDQDTPLYMAQEVFARLTSAPYRRLVLLSDGTHAIALERNRMRLICEVQHFLEEPIR